MDINRNHWFMAGIVLIALGIQFRLIESVVLNEPTTTFLVKRLKKKPQMASLNPMPFFASTPPRNLPVTPPKWIGWAMLSVGGVMVLHSLTMKRPG